RLAVGVPAVQHYRSKRLGQAHRRQQRRLPPALRAAQDRPAYTASVVQVAALDGRASKFGVDDVEVQDELRLLVGELQRRARTRPVRDDEMRSHPVQDDVTKGGEFARVVRTPPR